MSDPQSAKSDPRPSMVAAPVPKPALPKHLVGEATVPMLFPRKLSLNLDDYMGRVDFDEGLQEVPISLADYKDTGEPHWYLKQQGVVPYKKVPDATDAELASQLAARGYQVTPPEPEPAKAAETPKKAILKKRG